MVAMRISFSGHMVIGVFEERNFHVFNQILERYLKLKS